MDGQNFENENNVTVDTTATEVSSAAETVQETPVTEQPVNNYQDYTANVQPQAAATAPVQQPENKETNVLAIVSLVLGILSIVLGCCTGWIGALFGIGGIICAVFANTQGKTGLAKAGLICSIIGIVLGIIITILAAVFSVVFMSSILIILLFFDNSLIKVEILIGNYLTGVFFEHIISHTFFGKGVFSFRHSPFDSFCQAVSR